MSLELIMYIATSLNNILPKKLFNLVPTPNSITVS